MKQFVIFIKPTQGAEGTEKVTVNNEKLDMTGWDDWIVITAEGGVKRYIPRHQILEIQESHV